MAPPPASSDTPPRAVAGAGLAVEAALVGVGGAVGALARSGVGTLVTSLGGTGSAPTHLVNLVGAFALGVLVGRLEASGPSPRWRAFLGIGVLGSFTTFSTLIQDGRSLAIATNPAISSAMLAGALALGLAVFALGRRLGPRSRSGDSGPRVGPRRMA